MNIKGELTMKQNKTLNLSHDLFQIIKRFLRLDLKQQSIDGLTRSEQELLMLLVMNFDEAKKALTVTEISNLLQITPAGVTHLLNPLEETGCIERLPDPHDRRIVRIGLTDNGTRKAKALILDAQEKMAELVNLLGEEDSKTFIRLMTQVIGFFAS
jgi:DNA-binding MarR family transcriptional regulator